MTNEKNKKDVFLEAIKGTAPIKKSNKNYKPIPQTKINKSRPEKNLDVSFLDLKNNKKNEKTLNYKKLTIEKSNINKKLKRGLINVDKKVDFHGLSLKEAKSKFFETVDTCFFTRKRCILFVTGKGIKPSQNLSQKSGLFFGKIRNEFIKWTSEEEALKKILNVEQAGTSHGGDGAFFVYLRKNKN